MRLSEATELPFKLGAQLRHRRAFHPVGVLAGGTVERVAPQGEGLPVEAGDVIGRLSKGIGLRGGLPDFAGLAWRMHTGPSDATAWDVLMVSAGSSALGRVALRPATSWSGATFSTLMPLGYGGRSWWLRARIIEPQFGGGLALESLSEALRAREPIRVAVDQSRGLGDFTPLATLTFTDLEPAAEQHELAMDPTAHSAPGVDLQPRWLTALRRGAYRGSRKGRD
ncbi:phosphodiesterase [Mycolicibacterium mengxianglii]|uniref:phosphodiesterase n=1 Tax=Mycolicibacterium mengxianglii TaxID=2736649 RepID=UPI0018D19E1A|nr:phosphodiesterase [Mycolicibacterium mengxianglii]